MYKNKGSHFTLNALLHYLVKLEDSIISDLDSKHYRSCCRAAVFVMKF